MPYKSPFNVSKLQVGLHILQGGWYEITDATGAVVCTIPANGASDKTAMEERAEINDTIAFVLTKLNT